MNMFIWIEKERGSLFRRHVSSGAQDSSGGSYLTLSYLSLSCCSLSRTRTLTFSDPHPSDICCPFPVNVCSCRHSCCDLPQACLPLLLPQSLDEPLFLLPQTQAITVDLTYDSNSFGYGSAPPMQIQCLRATDPTSWRNEFTFGRVCAATIDFKDLPHDLPPHPWDSWLPEDLKHVKTEGGKKLGRDQEL